MSVVARCLDITRSISRLGRGAATGVDRVERAYLRAFAADPVPLWLLARTAFGYLLIGPDNSHAVLERVAGRVEWGRVDLLGALTRKAHPDKRRAEADLRRLAAGRCRHGHLAGTLARRLPAGTDYYNVGHSNLSDEVLDAWRRHPGAGSHVLVHDTIPLDYPQFQRPGTVESFRNRLASVARHADRVIFSTHAARRDGERWMAKWGRVPQSVVAPLGVDLPTPGPAHRPAGLRRPYFVVVGTIEPRKNHALLLDVWERLGTKAPQLIIAGRRGWNNEAVFRRLDNSPLVGRKIIERDDLDDAALAATLEASAGLLFPTLAEGYGLPPIEAAALQVPVICTDLPVLREVLGDLPVYVDGTDVYRWCQAITEMAWAEQADRRFRKRVRVPSWRDHFNLVLSVG